MRRSLKKPFAEQLLSWYESNNHCFPWRGDPNPYKIWLSEVMLQQTQVKTVIPYYLRWIEIFPDVEAVANANLDQILKQWEGLGYYARARNFYKACKIIHKDYSGHVPNNPKLFLSLPGVGSYICGAVMSIGFGRPLPAVDSNAARVISRLFCISTPCPGSNKSIANILSSLIPVKRPGDFNQALMDLGRGVCISNKPKCSHCPIIGSCRAYVEKSVYNFPVKTKLKKKPHYNVGVGVIWKSGKILISKRRENGLLGGLWEFPGGKIKNGESVKNCVKRECLEELAVRVRPVVYIKQIKHSYTHFSITLDAYHCNYLGGVPKSLGCSDWRWIKPAEIYDLAFPRACHKLFNDITMGDG